MKDVAKYKGNYIVKMVERSRGLGDVYKRQDGIDSGICFRGLRDIKCTGLLEFVLG